MASNRLYELGYKTIRELETNTGILASARKEIFGCIFGRDSLITSLELLRAYEKNKDAYLLSLVRKILSNLFLLQGRTVNIESGEEPGKCIHEYRPTNHEFLTQDPKERWYVYPDNIMRIYDTVDATPLLLIASYRYYEASGDNAFISDTLPYIRAAIRWIIEYGDTNHDGLIDYRFHPDRTHGGLHAQSWMDSAATLIHEDGGATPYPIAPVEVQGYTYLAFRLWADFFLPIDRLFANRLTARARKLKKIFNERFIIENDGAFSLAFAIDGNGRQIAAPRSSMGHVLWSVHRKKNGAIDGILDTMYVPKLAERLMMPDLFEPDAGIRTLSSSSAHFDPESYQNGSIWPHDTALIAEGFENYGFTIQAGQIRNAFLMALDFFQTPMELYTFNGGKYAEFVRPSGGAPGCREQAWSAGALLMATASL
jgi:glycogen debranching enzyme